MWGSRSDHSMLAPTVNMFTCNLFNINCPMLHSWNTIMMAEEVNPPETVVPIPSDVAEHAVPKRSLECIPKKLKIHQFETNENPFIPSAWLDEAAHFFKHLPISSNHLLVKRGGDHNRDYMSSSNLIGPGQHVDHGYTPYDFTSPFFMSMNPEDKIEIGYSKAASRKKRTSPSKRDDNLVDEFADLLKFNQDLLKIDPMENDIKNWDEEIRMIDPHLTAEGSDGKATYVDGMFLKRKRSENERHGSKNQGNMKKSKMGHIQLDFDPDWTPEEDYWFRKLLRDPEILHGKDHSNFKMDSQNPLGIVKRSIKNFVPGNSSPNLDQFYLRTLQYPYYNSKNYGKTQIYKRSFGSYDQRFKWARNLVKNKSKSKMKEQLSALKQRKQKMNWILKNSHKNLPTNNPLHKKNYQPSLVGAFNKQHERLQKNQDKNKQTDPFYSTDLDEGLSHGLEYSSYGRTKAGFDWDLLMNEF